jgi:exonuclease VII small subunit
MFIDDLLYVKKFEKALKTLEEKVHEMLLNERETFIKVYQNLQQSLKELEDELITIIKHSQKEKYDLKKSNIKK